MKRKQDNKHVESYHIPDTARANPLVDDEKLCYYGDMEAPTIVRKTKNYILVKIPLSHGRTSTSAQKALRGDRMTVAEKRSWKRVQEAKEDIRQGRTITAPSLGVALKRYAKRQWD